ELEPEAKGVAVERDRTAHVRDIDHDVVDLAEHDVPPFQDDPTYGLVDRQASRGCPAPAGPRPSRRHDGAQSSRTNDPARRTGPPRWASILSRIHAAGQVSNFGR